MLAMLNDTFVWMLLFATLTLGNSAGAQQKREPTPYGRLCNEWKAEVAALQAVTELPPDMDLRQSKRAINAKFTPRFLDLAKSHLDDDLWIDCLIWTSVEGVPGEDFDEMFDILRDHANSAKNPTQLQLLMSEFIPLQSERIDPALSAIAETHPEFGVRGAALFALAARTKRTAEANGDSLLAASAEKLVARVIETYPNVSTYRGENLENATALLEELRSPVALTKSAPNVRGVTLSGDEFDLLDTIRGKVAVLSFSGHWCGPCVAMHPVQKEILAKFPPESVVVVELNSDPLDKLAPVRSKIEAERLNWIVVTDGSNGPAAEQWRISAWPTYFVLDASGRIRHRASGNIGRRLIEWVEQLESTSE